MTKRLHLNNRGSFTVEAALIVPVIILCVMAVMYICILLYQYAFLQAVANKAVERGAAAWDNPEKNLETGSVSVDELKAEGIYWRLFDFSKDTKKANITKYINEKLGNGKSNLLKGKSTVEVDISDYIVYKKLKVTIENKNRIPIGKLLKAFGLDEYYTIKVGAESVVNEPVEFIRNTDFILDIEKEIEMENPKVKQLGDNVRGVIGKIQDDAIKFFNGSKDGAGI